MADLFYDNDLSTLGIVLLVLGIWLEFSMLLYPMLDGSLSDRIVKTTASSTNVVKAKISSIVKILQDFRSGIFYKPFFRKKPVIVRSPEAIQELCEALPLSQRAVYADIFGFQYTMTHANIDWDPNEQILLRYRLFARAIRISGLSQLSVLYPYLSDRLDLFLTQQLEPRLKTHEWTKVNITPIMRECVTELLGIYTFGKTLSEETDFSWAMRQYYKDTMACMGAMQVAPTFMRRFAYNMMTKNGRALDVLLSRLLKAEDPSQDAWKEDERLKKVTLYHNMLEASKESKYWTPIAVAQALLGIWFAASHQPWINLHFMFLELCARPEFIEPLREEIGTRQSLESHEAITQLPILDSFMKESVRLNPLDKMAIRRKALRPYEFRSTGQKVPEGDIACIPAWDFMHEESVYPNPYEFDGHRFVRDQNTTAPQKHMRGTTLTDPSKDFPIWGLGSKVWWHASLVMKMVMVRLIQKYDFKLEDDGQRVKWFWETFQMPYENTYVMMKMRGTNTE